MAEPGQSNQAEQPTQPPAAPNPPAEAQTQKAPRQARQWAMFCHLAGLAGYLPVLPFIGSVVAPLIIWQIKKEDSVFIDDQGKEAVNFQISILLYTLAAAVLVCIFIGIVLLPVVVVINVIFAIIAAVKANNGERYRYPLCIRFIK